MGEDTDGVGETFDDTLRIALTIASQMGERIARLREQFARQREATGIQEARELAARFEGERGAMRASLAPVKQSEWWDQASPQDVADMHETATAWKGFDDVAHDASDTIKREAQERFGVDVDAPGAGTVAVALAQAERDLADAAAARETAANEATATQLLFDLADRHEREAKEWANKDWNNEEFDGADIADFDEFRERDADWTQAGDSRNIPVGQEAEPSGSPRSGERETESQAYDSAERRQEFANDLESRDINQATVAARLLADGESSKHPREAVASTSRKAAKVLNKNMSSVHQRDRGGLSR